MIIPLTLLHAQIPSTRTWWDSPNTLALILVVGVLLALTIVCWRSAPHERPAILQALAGLIRALADLFRGWFQHGDDPPSGTA